MVATRTKKNNALRLAPILKWPGGKERELEQIFANAPAEFENYYEPFVGGGSVFMAMNASRFFINDLSKELISFYRCIASVDEIFFKTAKNISFGWKRVATLYLRIHIELKEIYLRFRNDREPNLKRKISQLADQYRNSFRMVIDKINDDVDVFVSDCVTSICSKMNRMKRIEEKKGLLSEKDLLGNIETALYNAFYINLRRMYNDKQVQLNRAAIFFFIRNLAYSGMFRYNNKGDFNVPYGGMGYNGRNFDKKIKFYQSAKVVERFKQTDICNDDFERFLKNSNPTNKDFLFLDPPYDSEFSTYAKNSFGRNDQIRLANYLIKKCKAKWMLVIKYTDFIYSLYAGKKGISIKSFEKRYAVSFMNRNNQKVTHLIVRNYV